MTPPREKCNEDCLRSQVTNTPYRCICGAVGAPAAQEGDARWDEAIEAAAQLLEQPGFVFAFEREHIRMDVIRRIRSLKRGQEERER